MVEVTIRAVNKPIARMGLKAAALAWLGGLIAGLLFVPTTIFDMIWGVRFPQEAHGVDYGSAVMRSTTVPLGWIIGSPLLGLILDRMGRRKPVIIGGGGVLLACLACILYGSTDVSPLYVLGLVAGLASGAALLQYTVIKEVNPPRLGGPATGVVNFISLHIQGIACFDRIADPAVYERANFRMMLR